jgi:uncharacterized membrane protein
MRPVRELLQWVLVGVGGVALWLGLLAYLTYRVCRASGGMVADSIYSCAMPGGQVLPWFAVVHPVTTLISVAAAAIAVILTVRWLRGRGGRNAV